MSMAAGKYVSVSSQSDMERADLARERQELKQDPIPEREELARIYVRRGLKASSCAAGCPTTHGKRCVRSVLETSLGSPT